ncbi:MAG: hypothetical protein UU13_C0023G0003 [Candidatus Nomurabacteria bacterium GW2011_GWB1_40_7]|uniref:Uncharacterized protein n=1 Tax=Candidatus Nomurabacteria bacterium GW2011_GWB1_40_7 TaxID=1618744 RepID=A0A0G0VCC9_9BACT|nr:MAG: hypothetical protein UU13_C0023G0003 [Candidatus Nomurabacteria bacterium GW2011_GWB1_40_7]
MFRVIPVDTLIRIFQDNIFLLFYFYFILCYIHSEYLTGQVLSGMNPERNRGRIK